MESTKEEEERSVIFTYGTLKRGFSNHGLIEDLVRAGDAAFLGPARSRDRLPLVCGPFRVPFLLDMPGSGRRVRGELYSVSARGLSVVDELEGTRTGHYRRLPIRVVVSEGCGGEEVVEEVEAYYADESYAGMLWRRSGEEGMESYSEREAKGYVKRRDRPQNLTFLEQIRIYVGSPAIEN